MKLIISLSESRAEGRARAQKSIGFVTMNPTTFLELTATHENIEQLNKDVDVIEREHGNAYVFYNQFDDQLCHLDIDILRNKVVGHEGRHRAVAAQRSRKLLKTAIYLREHLSIIYYRELEERGYAREYLGQQDIPSVVESQFGTERVNICQAIKSFKSFR